MSENKLIPSVLNDAVSEGPDSVAYKRARKLTALALAERNPKMNGAEAAVRSDRSWFQKAIEFMVGIGTVDAEDGVHRLIDRGYAALVSFTENTLPELVVKGCVGLGIWIGSLFGNPVAGRAIGLAIGNFLNKPVQEVAQIGVDLLREAAHSMWNALKAGINEKALEFRRGKNVVRTTASNA